MDNNELLTQIASMLEDQTEMINKKLKDQSRDLKLYIENKVEKRIEALFDGYKLVHEKQWEQDKQISDLRDDLEAMKVELYSLKKKVG